MRIPATTLGLLVLSAGLARGEGSADAPRPVPLTRPEMKQLLEDMKARTPRIPLPALTAEEKEKYAQRASMIGGGYEGRLRSLYLSNIDVRPTTGPAAADTPKAAGAAGGRPGGGGGFGFSGYGFGREQDSKMSLDYPFKTELFWIVSRTNNCQYCLGHQESKLLAAGLTEEDIASLDSDWSKFTPKQRAAFAFARKLTYEPHLLNDADIKDLREYYTDLQILEMVLSVSGNNQINRWKEGAGIPQSSGGGNFGRRPGEAAKEAPAPKAEGAHSYLTPTPERFQKVVTKVAPLVNDEKTGAPTTRTVARRPALESRPEVEKMLEICRHRSPRLPVVPDAKAREIVSTGYPEGRLPQWVCLLANFPRDGVRVMAGVRNVEEKGDLSPLLKAQVSWIVARQDRAWYAAGRAMSRLHELGQTDEQIFKLDGDLSGFTPAERAQFVLARNLGASPVVLTDSEVDQAVKLVGPRDVVQLINFTTTRASFDRITEAAGLPLDK